MRARLCALLASGMALAACGSLDTGQLEEFTAQKVEETIGLMPASVQCPDDVGAKAGDEFACTITGADGTSAAISVRQKDDEGNVEISGLLIKTPELERAIAAQANLDGVAVDCPDIVPIEAGKTFECTAASDGGEATLVVTMQDDEGNVTFEQKG